MARRQEAKHTLSERAQGHGGLLPRRHSHENRGHPALFEDSLATCVERTETHDLAGGQQAGLEWPEIDRVLLVGGSSRMPMIAQMLRKVTDKEPDCSLSPDEVVAHGAALYAAMLVGDTTCRPKRLPIGERQFP